MQPSDSARNGKREVRVETSAGGVVFRRPAPGASDAKVLLIRDAYSNWGLPKGHLEAGEVAEEAALREVREETGLSDLELGPLLLTIDWHFNSGTDQVHKFCHFFLIESRSGETVPQLEEGITECVWVPVSTAVEQISYANAREVLKLAGERLGAEGLVQSA